MNTFKSLQIKLLCLSTLALGACSSNDSGVTPPAPVADITASGVVYDGPVAGGSLYVFSAADVNQVISDADASDDRAASLAGASPLAILVRDAADGADFSLTVSGDLANQALFFVFDSADAEDESFADEPFNLEAVAIAGAAGSSMQINLTPHTSLSSIQVRAQLDAADDAAAIQSARDTAWSNVVATFGSSSLGDDLFPGGEDAHSTGDLDILSNASGEIGLAVRRAALLNSVSMNDVLMLFAADAADGMLDGFAPLSFGLNVDQEETLVRVAASQLLGAANVNDTQAVSCNAASNSLRRACEFEVLDEFFIGIAVCAHSETEADAADCIADYSVDRDDAIDECSDVTDARLELCAATADAVHNPPFGPDFASDFVDPLTIGTTTPVNPYFPMVQGTVWTYEGTFEEDGEEITEVITITVTDKIKLVDGIRCLVVRDVVEIDGELIEDTNDWFAQDTDGNIWYCGEEVQDYETFDGDVPSIPELVAIDGAFKAGRDGDEAGMLLPFAPVVGDIIRQEVSFANAEDTIEILAIDGTETVPAAACDGDCLVTRDFSPLDPGVEENKYYAPGIGKILEVDLENGSRFELIAVTTAAD
ncbi:MAG: hypothetical protein WBN61_03285 [Woeseiaceae bacterium]